MLTRQVIRTAVEAALEEDAPNGDITCETTIPDASFSVPTLAMGGTQLPGEEGAAMKICCLTFDDGPSKYTPQVLAALEKCDAKATFFVTAQDANQDYLPYRRQHQHGQPPIRRTADHAAAQSPG